MELFGKTLQEYILPIKFYVICSVLIVISQYAIALPLSDKYPFLLKLTQGIWMLMVALSAIKLILKYGDFGMKNVIALGVMYSIIIHGLKVSIRYVFYGKDLPYMIDRLAYGSFLVMAVAIFVGAVFIWARKEGMLKGMGAEFLRRV